jgi:hypothetical protein
VNDFVEKCRHEWKRLGVPDPIADEMAAELAADLDEAEAEGASLEDVVGSGADPRSFAAVWAGERAVVQHRLTRRSRVPAAIATFALIPTIVGAVLLILAAPSGSKRLAAPLPSPALVMLPAPPAPAGGPPEERARAAAFAAQLAHVRAVYVKERALVATGHTNGSDDGARTLGSVLLIVGLAGIVSLTLWLWVDNDRWSRRRT